MTRLHVPERVEELGLVTKLARDCPQPACVLGMAPSRIVPSAVGMGDERDARRAQLRTGRLLRCVSRNMDPSRAPASVSDWLSSNISYAVFCLTKKTYERAMRLRGGDR